MVVLYPKCFLCSIRCFSSFPPTISLQSLRFLQFSPLSSPSSFPSTPFLNVISGFLIKECGFSSSQVTTVMRRQPKLLRKKSDHTARKAIHLLKDFELTNNQLKSLIVRNPTILSATANGQLKPKMEFLKNLGLATQEMRQIICRNPRLLTMSLENTIYPRITNLRNLFGSTVHLCLALKTVSELLTTDFEKQVKPKVEYVKNNIGISEGSKAFLRALYAIISQSFETLEKKIKHMASLGLAEEEILLILKGNPIILSCSTKKVKENIDFLIHIAGLMPRIFAPYPLFLSYSVEKRLKPRYEVFKYLRTNQQSKPLPSLTKIFQLSEKEFLKRFGQYDTEIKSNDNTIS
ncbi:transcription termination factor MTERF9, chloroplastic [Cryptomeria japonica]|uniref:transcription termination factor MTERF9, chloroplastic n=1 Tax=Cryptomeria japonica TaxID=3369 RepID=UPI0027DA8232|nr:transcription termination factor MTERF9, chloroplastic [Cryptomeria japonica]